LSFTGNFTCDIFLEGLFESGYNFDTDTFKIALYTNSATLNASTNAYTTDGEVVAPGYAAGGITLTVQKGFANGTSFVTFANVSWSGAFTARGALIYKVGGGNPAVCVLDFGADKTSTTTFQVQFPAASSTDALIRLS
jgi:hypothetical protein